MSTTVPGADYFLPYPGGLSVDMPLGVAGAYINMAQYIPRTSLKIARIGSSLRSTLSMEIWAIGGGGFNITNRMPIRVYDPNQTYGGGTRYVRYGLFFVSRRATRQEGNNLVWVIDAVDYNFRLDRPVKPFTAQWPGGDGTPVVSTTSLTAIAGGGGSFNFVPRSLMHLYNGKNLYAMNADGTNRERIQIGIAAGVYSATFQTQKIVYSTTVSSGAFGAGSNITVTTAGAFTAAQINTQAQIIIQNSNGLDNEEVVIPSAVNVGAHQFTATFALPHDAGAQVKVRWLLVGGESDINIIKNGFYMSLDPLNPTVLTHYAGFMDSYYAGEGYPVDLSAVRELIHGYPTNLKAVNESQRKFLGEMRDAAGSAGNISATCSTNVTAGTTVTLVVSDTSNMYPDKGVVCANADGTSQEVVQILAVGQNTMRAFFASSKTVIAGQPWTITGRTAPQWFMTVGQDDGTHNNWGPAFVYMDGYDLSLQGLIELSDVVPKTSTIARYGNYSRLIDGNTYINSAAVSGSPSTGAVGFYSDPVRLGIDGGVPIYGDVIVDESLLTNEECVERAKQEVLNFYRDRETITNVVTKSQIDMFLFLGGRLVRWGNTGEGGTPTTYAVAQVTLSFETGVATYTFELGDRIPELGDKALQIFGAVDTRDHTPPSRPNWDTAGTPPNWLLEDFYDPATRTSTMHVQWTHGQEFDLDHFLFQWREHDALGNPLNWSPNQVVRYTGNPQDAYARLLTPNRLVDFRVSAVDKSGNESQLSSEVSYTSSAAFLPNHPTSFSVTSSYLNENGRRGNIRIGWTQGAADPTHSGDDGGGYDIRCIYTTVPAIRQIDHAGSGDITAVLHNFIVGAPFTVEIQQIDQYGQRSAWQAASNSPYTVQAVPNSILYNGNFIIPHPLDATQPDGWIPGGSGGATGAIDTTTPLAGGNSYKMTAGGGQTKSLVSEPIAVINTANTDVNAIASIAMSLVYKATNANGTLHVTAAWYSDAAASVGVGTPTEYFPSPFHPVAGVHPINTKQGVSSYLPPAGAITARLIISFAGGVSTNDIWIAGVRFGVATNPSSFAPTGGYALGTDPVTGDKGSLSVLDALGNAILTIDANPANPTLTIADFTGAGGGKGTLTAGNLTVDPALGFLSKGVSSSSTGNQIWWTTNAGGQMGQLFAQDSGIGQQQVHLTMLSYPFVAKMIGADWDFQTSAGGRYLYNGTPWGDMITKSNPLTAQDDLWIGGASGVPARLAKGGNGQVPTVDPATGHIAYGTQNSWVKTGTVKYAAYADGNPIIAEQALMGAGGILRPADLGTTVARCLLFRLPRALAVTNIWIYPLTLLTNAFQFAIYPMGVGTSRLWTSGTISTTAFTWLDIAGGSPPTLAADTAYLLCVSSPDGVTNSNCLRTLHSNFAVGMSTLFGANSSPLAPDTDQGGLGIFQVAVTSGVLPATLPSIAAFTGSTGGTVPPVLLIGVAS